MTEDEAKTLIDSGGSAPSGRTSSGSHLPIPPTPEHIGKFEILRKLGEGGMGVVYEGVDPKLSRRVAIKLMRPSQREGRDAHGQDRMMREATTLARLSHPNVVQVYEVGEYEGSIFLAMELIAGVDLRQWLKARQHTWREVLAVFMQAGQGLAAAHHVGVVHRDFKPDNVLVGDDGRVRVLDFGLARPLRQGDVQEVVRASGPSGNRITLTQANSYVGTPAYMSPEQHLREPRVDARSDQFSFCVALYEGLYGERPFAGKTAGEVRMSVFRAVPPAPEGRHVPARLRRILLRGLRVDADERYPDMPALLAELSVDLSRPWKLFGLAAATLAVATLGAVAYAGWEDQGRAACTGGAELVARVWSPARASAGAAAFKLTGVAYAADTWPKVQAELDVYAAALAASRDDACLAAAGRGDGPETFSGLRLQCVDERQRELGALVDAFVTADAATVERAVQAATALTPPAVCADEGYVATRVRPPDPALARQVDEARSELVRAAARREAGRPLEAREIAGAVEVATRDLSYAPLRAELQLELGRGDENAADYPQAIEHLTAAYHEGLAIGHDTVAADAAVHLNLVYHRQGNYRDAFAWSEHARSMVQRTGSRPEHLVPYLLYRSYTLSELDRHKDAIEAAERALAVAEASFRATDPRIGRMIAGVAHAQWAKGDATTALALFERSKAEWQVSVGGDHPFIASSAINISTIYHNRHEYDRALAEVRPALDIMRRAYGDDHPSVANVLGNLGSIALAQGRFHEAIAHLERCADILARKVAPDAGQTLEASSDLATAQLLIGRLGDALATQRRVIDLRKKKFGAVAPLDQFELAEILADMRRTAEAEAAYRAALAAADPDHPDVVVHALAGLARLARARGELAEADALSLRTVDTALAVEPIQRAPGLVERGETLLALGRADEAALPCKEALQEFEKAYGESSYQNVPALLCLGRIYTARTQDAAARQVLERAVTVLDATDIRLADRADARVALAAAVRRDDPARADELLARAAADYAAAGPLFADDAARLRKPAP